MGCNSHLSIEIQEEWGSSTTFTWSTWALDIPESRDYRLYEAMAGVRGGEENAIVAPRGIPTDASDAVAYWVKRYGEDGHTHSWLYPKEFHAAVERVKAIEGYGGVYKEWSALDKILLDLESVYGVNRVRVVFYFDN